MKRSYDTSFITDTDNITSLQDAHSFQPQSATQATHHPIGDFGVTHNLYLGRNSGSLPVTSTLELRVPLLVNALELRSDFQSNARFAPTDVSGDGASRVASSQGSEVRPRLSGLGIRYEGPFGLTSPLFAAESVSPPSLSKSPALRDDKLRVGRTGGLTLRDLCHVEDSPALGLVESLRQRADCDLFRYMDDNSAYSEHPTREYTAHSPPASASLPSFSFDTSSDEYLAEDRSSPGKGFLSEIMTLYTPPSRATEEQRSRHTVGIFVDINMRELAAKQELPGLGVNPAHIMGTNEPTDSGEHGSPDCEEDFTEKRSESPLHDQDNLKGAVQFPQEAISAIVSVLSSAKPDNLQGAHSISQPENIGTPQDFHNVQEYCVQPRVPTRSANFEFPAQSVPAQFVAPGVLSLQSYGSMQRLELQYPYPDTTPMTKVESLSPVLNAHLGVSLEDLRRRAEEFRQRNPGMELDKAWLQAYAGRLSQRGELIDDYRCYVLGCTQTNKRRDHILVHVGAHVEHRPFQCDFCGMRFLRKNECKRHEGSHGGRKPFACPICAPYQDRAFVRQDLLKRHMRVSHGVVPNPADRRKRIRIEEREEWP